jgi:hypothetical protein
MFEALTDEMDRWLPTLLANETRPKATRATTRPSLLVFRPWLDPTIREVIVEIMPDENSGSALRVLATASVPLLSDEERRRVRYRLGTVFGGVLRAWVDEPHW